MWTGARLVSGLMLCAAATYAMHVYLSAQTFEEDPPWKLFYGAAAFVGFWAGWRPLGKRLGQGFGAAFGTGVTAVGIGFVVICGLTAIRSVVKVYDFRSFRTVGEMMNHFMKAALETAQSGVADLTLVAGLVAAGAVTGLVAEVCDRSWR